MFVPNPMPEVSQLKSLWESRSQETTGSRNPPVSPRKVPGMKNKLIH